MNKKEILKWIRSLAKSQGFYGKVLEEIENNPNILNKLEKKNFKDVVDLCFFLEGC